MDNDSTATIPTTVVVNAVYDRITDCMLAGMRSAAVCGDAPGASREAKLTANRSSWTIVIGELDVLVEHLPLLVPTPQGGAVDATLSGCNGHG
jgi:hypothetical protein